MHRLVIECPVCGLIHTHNILTEYTFPGQLSRSVRADVSGIVSIIQKHFQDTTHSSIFIDHTYEEHDIQAKYEIPYQTFRHFENKGEFKRLIISFLIQRIERVDHTVYDLLAIDSLLRTEEDVATLAELRSRRFSNRHIIAFFINKTEREDVVPEVGQKHLELDESQLESTGKSVPIEDVLDNIDKVLEEQKEADNVRRKQAKR